MSKSKVDGRLTMRWLCSEFSYRDKDRDELEIKEMSDFIEEVQDAIEVGCPHDVPGGWGSMVRQLFQEQDFFVKGNRVFKKTDKINDALDGNYGRDISDADEDTFEEMMGAYCDRPDVQAWITDNQDDLQELNINPYDALNFAERGLEGAQLKDFYQLMDTESLNSPFCAKGYSQPRDIYEMVNRERRSVGTQNKNKRQRHLANLMMELKDIDDEQDLNRFLDRIRDDYYDDKNTRHCWNEKAFKEDRALYLDSMRKRGFDEEKIRRQLFACFDAEKVEVKPIRTIINGVKTITNQFEIDRAKKTFDSLWRRARIQALNEQTLTVNQWAKIYELSKHVRTKCRRILGGFKPSLPNRLNYARQMILTCDPNSLSKAKVDLMTDPNIQENYKLDLSEMFLLWSNYLYKNNLSKRKSK